jgi:Ca2+-binding RTX toxin-like protein
LIEEEGALNIDDAVLAKAIAKVDDRFDVDGVKNYTLQVQGNDLVLTIKDVDGGNNQNSSEINGTRGDNNLRGTNADDFIAGNNGNDTLKGGRGNDTIEGGRGGDDIRVS